MRLCVVGCGYVGLVTGACLADLGHEVVCVDRDRGRVELLRGGSLPFHEPGLDEVVARNRGRLSFGTDIAEAAAGASIAFIAVGTPADAQGRPRIDMVLQVAAALRDALPPDAVVVVKSTVPPGTADEVRAACGREVVSNPEFLSQGTAVDDFCRPDRVVLGSRDAGAAARMERLYAPFLRTGRPVLHMDNRSAELAKYAANAMLASRISFMNEVAGVCEALGADVEAVRHVVGSDARVGPRYLFPGVGYGGSCLPKDVRALVAIGEGAGRPMRIAAAIHAVNADQRKRLVARLREGLGGLEGAVVAMWGLAFKPETDDLRDAPSLDVVAALVSDGAKVVAHDPWAGEAALRRGLPVALVDDPYAAVEGADALVVLTEWRSFRSPDLHEIRRRMRGDLLVDGRNLYRPEDVVEAGLRHVSIGRATCAPGAEAPGPLMRGDAGCAGPGRD